MAICVSYQRSIDKLRLPQCGSYGVIATGENECNLPWDLRQRNNWIDALAMAQEQIESDLGAPLCAQEICDEMHRPRCDLQLNFKPIAYLGQKVYGAWATAAIVYSGTHPDIVGTAEICDVDYDDINADNLDFTYPEIDCYAGQLPLQTPCVKQVVCNEGEVDESDGLQFIWPACQLLIPDVETATLPGTGAEVAATNKFLAGVRYRTWTIDEDLAYEPVGECACAVCSVAAPTYTIAIGDAQLGTVCIESVNSCLRRDRRLKINYATSYNCGLSLDLNLEWAVILLALTKVGQELCGCSKFQDMQSKWLARSLDASQPLVVPWKLNYGSTEAGMEVARIVANELRRMHFTAASRTGGQVTTFNRQRSFRSRVLAW